MAKNLEINLEQMGCRICKKTFTDSVQPVCFLVWNVYFTYQRDVNDAECHWKVSLISRLHALRQYHSCRTLLCFLFTSELSLMISQGSQKFESSFRVWTAPASTQTSLRLLSTHSQQPHYEVDIGAWEGPGRFRCPVVARMRTLVAVDFGRASRHIFAIDNKHFGNASNTTKQSQWCVASPQWKPAQNVNRVLLGGGRYTHFDRFMSRVVSLVYKLSFLLSFSGTLQSAKQTGF